MRTSRVSTSSTARWICETLVTSSVRGVTRLSVLCSALRAPAYTLFAPRLSASSTSARPMPRLAPVINTVFFSSFTSFSFQNFLFLSRRKKVLGQGTVIFCRKMMFFVKEHFFLLLDWYYASPPGQDTWAKPNNCAETLTAICGSASPVFSHSPKKVLTWPYRHVTI